MKKIIRIVATLLTFVLMLPIIASASSAVVEFRDLDGYGWAKESIENLHTSGVFKGTGNDVGISPRRGAGNNVIPCRRMPESRKDVGKLYYLEYRFQSRLSLAGCLVLRRFCLGS